MMIESINSIQNIYTPSNSGNKRVSGSLMDFSDEDLAIISAQAKILNELEKFNAGEGNDIELAMASILGETQVEAAAAVIRTKNEMMDSLMEAF